MRKFALLLAVLACFTGVSSAQYLRRVAVAGSSPSGYGLLETDSSGQPLTANGFGVQPAVGGSLPQVLMMGVDQNGVFHPLSMSSDGSLRVTTVNDLANSAGAPIEFMTNGVDNNTQTVLNIIAGANMSATADSVGGVTLAATSAIAGPQGVAGIPGIAGADGAQGTPGYSPDALTSGGGVVWTSGYSFRVSGASYTIGGSTFTSAESSVTLAAADGTNDRIDVIAVDNTGAVVVLQGTPSATPVEPAVDPATQLALTFIYVTANSTQPANVVTTDIYHENTEWSSTKSGTPINLASTNNPHSGSLDIEATAAVKNNTITLTDPGSATINVNTRNNLVFYLRSKAAWPTSRVLEFEWLNAAGTKVGSIISVGDGTFGFTSSNTATYQQIVIPIGLFATNNAAVASLKIIAAGGTTASFGFYLDDITLQGGLPAPVTSSAMLWQGPWNSSTSYAVNNVVSNGGATYVALQPNVNVTPTAGAVWAEVGSTSAGGGASALQSATVTLTASQLIAMTGTDVAAQTIVAAQGANKVIIPQSFTIEYLFGSAAFTGTMQFALYPGTQATADGNSYSNLLEVGNFGGNGTSSTVFMSGALQLAFWDDLAVFANQPLTFGVVQAGTATGGGTGDTVVITVWYVVLTMS